MTKPTGKEKLASINAKNNQNNNFNNPLKKRK
jgi:hypothetical protein